MLQQVLERGNEVLCVVTQKIVTTQKCVISEHVQIEEKCGGTVGIQTKMVQVCAQQGQVWARGYIAVLHPGHRRLGQGLPGRHFPELGLFCPEALEIQLTLAQTLKGCLALVAECLGNPFRPCWTRVVHPELPSQRQIRSQTGCPSDAAAPGFRPVCGSRGGALQGCLSVYLPRSRPFLMQTQARAVGHWIRHAGSGRACHQKKMDQMSTGQANAQTGPRAPQSQG